MTTLTFATIQRTFRVAVAVIYTTFWKCNGNMYFGSILQLKAGGTKGVNPRLTRRNTFTPASPTPPTPSKPTAHKR